MMLDALGDCGRILYVGKTPAESLSPITRAKQECAKQLTFDHVNILLRTL